MCAGVNPNANPYLNRLMIRQPENFYGRRREVTRVLSRIGAERPQSISIVGERRMGKSSLLCHLTSPDVRRRYLGGLESLVVIFLDFQQLRSLAPAEFFSLLCDRIRAEAPGLPPGTLTGYSEFQKLLDCMAERNQTTVLLFDEFDAVTSNPLFRGEFYSFLRSMANNYPVSYVTSSRVELQSLCHSADIADSPFFNIFTNLRLTPFSREETLELISKPSQVAGIPLEGWADYILEIAGHLPFFLQIACCACFDFLADNPGKELQPDSVESRFLEEAVPHYEYLTSHLSEDCLDVLNRVARGRQLTAEDLHVCRPLLRDGYLLEDGKDQVRVASRLFAEYLCSRAPQSHSGQRRRSQLDEEGLKLCTGSRLDQYEVLRLVGEGGMGCVYEAEDKALGRKVALKLVKPQLLGTGKFRRRFLQEARLAAALNHPAITSVFELTEHSNQVVLVMEWLEGKTLKQVIQEQGRLDWRRLVQWLSEAASGLEAAHRQGIVHRDVKSANLFVTSQDRLKILDFGLAKHLLPASPGSLSTQMSTVGMLIGTIDYMSPEQASAQPIDARSDLFSLGVVFFEGLTGALPFRRNNVPATLHAIVNEPVPDLTLYDVQGAERIEPILHRLLQKDPAQRFQTAAQLEKELREVARRRRFLWF